MFSFESIGRRAAVAAILGLVFVSVESLAQSGQPFAGMSGVWSGKGTISLEGGAREAIRCRATYAVRSDGNALEQTLRCASDSYKIELTSNVVGFRSWSARGLSPRISRSPPAAIPSRL